MTTECIYHKFIGQKKCLPIYRNSMKQKFNGTRNYIILYSSYLAEEENDNSVHASIAQRNYLSTLPYYIVIGNITSKLSIF